MMIAAVLALLCTLASPQGERSVQEKHLTRFARQHLAGVAVVAEVEVGKTRRLGMAVDVVTLHPQKILIHPSASKKEQRRALVVLSNRGEYVEGARFMVFLDRFGSGDRFVTRQRLSLADRNYKDKARLIEEYIGIEKTADPEKRAGALKTMLLKNIADPSEWVRWNTLRELEALVAERSSLFSQADLDAIDAVDTDDFSESYRKALAEVRAAIYEAVKEADEDSED